MNTPWYKQAIIYSLNVETFMDSNGDGTGDFQGLTRSLDYLADLGITCLWLLPFFQTPMKADGYDVLDHFSINPDYGTMEDFEAFIARAKELGIRVIIDLILHHTSDQHQWFLESKKKNSKYTDYYIWSAKIPEDVKKKFQKELWTFDEAAGEYYLHRFSRFEPDLNLANPDVKNELRGIVEFWLSKGVSGFRIDVAHIIIDLEQTTIRKTRDLTVLNTIHDAAFKNGELMLVAEAEDLPARLQRYYGNGDRMNVFLNFLLNQSMFLSLAREEGIAIENEIKKLPIQPDNAQWVNFIRNHDEFMLDKLTADEMNEVFDAFAPDEKMRISGKGIRRRIAPMMKNRKQMELFYSLVFSFPGIPLIRYGDEIGMGEDLSLEGRKSVRTAMQWNNDRNAGFSTADSKQLVAPVIGNGAYGYQEVNVIKQKRNPDSFLNWIKKLIRIRKKITEIGEGIFSIINTDNPDVLVHKIAGEKNIFIAIHNLSGNDINLNINMSLIEARVIFADNRDNETFNEMAAYGYRWLLLPNKGKVKGT